MNGVVFPTAGLLDSDGAPFVFGEKTGFGKGFGQFFGEDYVSIISDILRRSR